MLLALVVTGALLASIAIWQLPLWSGSRPQEEPDDEEGNIAPVADFLWIPMAPRGLELVTFHAQGSRDPDGSIENFTWDFGDGTVVTTNQYSVLHFFFQEKVHSVKLTVVDDRGAEDRAAKQVLVEGWPNSITEEDLTISLSPVGAGPYSVWIPLLLGSTFVDPSAFGDNGAEITLLQNANGTFLNITSTGELSLSWHSKIEGPRINESFIDYEWSTQTTPAGFRVLMRAFAADEIRVSIRFDATSGLWPAWVTPSLAFGGCLRSDEILGTLDGHGIWGQLAVIRTGVLCA